MRDLTLLQAYYLVVAVAGAVGTWSFNLQVEDLSRFFVDAWATPLSSSLMMDLTGVSLAFFAFMLVEQRRRVISPFAVGLIFVLTFLVAIAFTLPLFLFLRERSPLRRGRPEADLPSPG